jgi:hypothetical protein
MPGRRHRLARVANSVFGTLKHVGGVLAEPLTVDPEAAALRLPVPDAQTTTMDGDVGWGRRPAAVLACPNCENDIYQHRPTSSIDCSTCWREFDHTRFPELDLRHLICPTCGEHMRDGKRHPEQFDIPEWATCDSCEYHWEFEHF